MNHNIFFRTGDRVQSKSAPQLRSMRRHVFAQSINSNEIIPHRCQHTGQLNGTPCTRNQHMSNHRNVEINFLIFTAEFGMNFQSPRNSWFITVQKKRKLPARDAVTVFTCEHSAYWIWSLLHPPQCKRRPVQQSSEKRLWQTFASPTSSKAFSCYTKKTNSTAFISRRLWWTSIN